MSFVSDLRERLDALDAALGDIAAAEVPAAVARLADAGVVGVIADATVLVRGGEMLRIAASGVVAARSTRDAGHGGLAQVRGHRNPVSLVQELTGTTRADAVKQVRLGEALTAGVAGAGGGGVGTGVLDVDDGVGDGAGDADATAATVRPWHACLGDAVLTGQITSAQHDVILRGLGDPPTPATPGPAGDRGAGDTEANGAAGEDAGPHGSDAGAGDTETDGTTGNDAGGTDVDGADGTSGAHATAADLAATAAEFAQVWALAATELIAEAPHRTVEELGRTARTVRDQLDPAGAARRFEQRYAARSFRMWTDADGIQRGSFCFDDHAAVWVRTILDTALRPRRGGPRFVDPTEKAAAETLVADPRTNDQLAYDLLIDVLRAGALADAKTVFGTKQAGIRILITQDTRNTAAEGRPAVGLVEEDLTTLPGWLVAQHECDTGTMEWSVDRDGNPLYLGREARLYSSTQKLVLAARDGGCRWTGCDRPASYCETHHIDPYAHGGRTDVDRGISLCRFHHMNLHHGGWHITRNRLDDFVLHPPDGGNPITLKPRLALRYAWGDTAPPPQRFQPAA